MNVRPDALFIDSISFALKYWKNLSAAAWGADRSDDFAVNEISKRIRLSCFITSHPSSSSLQLIAGLSQSERSCHSNLGERPRGDRSLLLVKVIMLVDIRS